MKLKKINKDISTRTTDVAIDGQNTTLLSGNKPIWGTLTSFLIVGTSGLLGSSNPIVDEYRSGFKGLLFARRKLNEVYVDFQIKQDIDPGTIVYPNIHWMPTTNSGGTVRWGFEWVVIKGHNQMSFPNNTTTRIVTETVQKNTRYRHRITTLNENLTIPGDDIEPDSVIKLRVFRDGANDSYDFNIHAWAVTLKYQIARIGAINRFPDFYENN